MGKKSELIVGLDIGTTKIAAIVGETNGDGVDVIGVGTHSSRGLRKGVVTHIDNTVGAIKHAVEEAELMAGCEISTVYAGIAGGHIQGLNSQGMVAVKDGEVRKTDIDRVIEAAKAHPIPMDKEIIHVLPQDFVVDGQDGINEPLGMSGVRLETRVHIVTAAVTSAQNIIKCCQRCGLHVEKLVLQPLASADAVLFDDERELGVALVDIGGGTTDITLFVDGSIVYTSVVAVGGNHISNDIAIGLRTPYVEAERLKKRWGCASSEMVGVDEEIEVPSVGGREPRKIGRRLLCDIIEPRVAEIFRFISHEIDSAGCGDLLASGVVITGGSAVLEAISDLAGQVLDRPVRCGYPHSVGGLTDVVRNPRFATGVGLMLYGIKTANSQGTKLVLESSQIARRLRDWFQRAF